MKEYGEGYLQDLKSVTGLARLMSGLRINVGMKEYIEGIDIRRYVDDAKRDLKKHFVRYSRIPDLGYLKVIVGCKVHGVGKGKLRLAITEMLEHDKTIEWKRENGHFIISIKLDDKKDYSLLGGDVREVSHLTQGKKAWGAMGRKWPRCPRL